MTDAERQRAIRERVDRLLAELRAAAESDPERLSSVDFMVLLVNSIGRRMLRKRAADVTLDAAQVSILVDGVVELLTDWATSDLAAEIERAEVLQRTFAGKPAILH